MIESRVGMLIQPLTEPLGSAKMRGDMQWTKVKQHKMCQ